MEPALLTRQLLVPKNEENADRHNGRFVPELTSQYPIELSAFNVGDSPLFGLMGCNIKDQNLFRLLSLRR